ncbi:Ku protein [Streptomyces africanus]|uniref:Ku protein n=1 Tax=Streptomyces africanus TaxID=231024 RepID=A0ABU0QEY3_9ACTN|nr:Ku protein [Streptomyces africanus]MDQ0745957.1 Ku protein [Streptomyces africanus]
MGGATIACGHTVHFHQLQRGTSDRIRNRRVNERAGKEVAGEDIVKGFEVGEGKYVIVDPDELDQIAPGRSQTIEVSDFVGLEEIEPVHFDRTYDLARAARSTPRSTSCCGRRRPGRTWPASPRS